MNGPDRPALDAEIKVGGYSAPFLTAATLSCVGIALVAVMLKRLDVSGPAGARPSAERNASAPGTT